MSGTAILCSGQGPQGPGMFNLLANAPQAAAVFAAAARVLGGRDPRVMVEEANDDELHGNKIGQILCCTQAMAAWAVLDGSVSRPLVVAGYSVGELAAWGVAGVLDAYHVLDLAAKRAEAMDEATKEPSGLAAIHGLSRSKLEPICREHDAFIAIINSNDQFLVGGTQKALATLVVEAKAHGARSTTMLPVAVPSHTPLLSQASDRFRHVLHDTKAFGEMPSSVRLLSGIDGDAVFDLTAGVDKLARQIQQTVDWAACMEACQAAAVTKVVELGPGSALARMMQATMPDSDAHSISEFHSLDGLKHWLETSQS